MHVFLGVVQKGTQRASDLGFPTVNIPLEDKDLSGIFAAHVLLDGVSYKAAVFADPKRSVLEAHLIDFPSQTLYGKEITIELMKKIRENEMFGDDAALRAAIARDVEMVKNV